MLRSSARLLAVVWLAATFPAPCLAQVSNSASLETEFLEPLPGVGDSDPIPLLSLEVLREFELPGPLPPSGPTIAGGRIVMNVAGGIASADVDGGEAPSIDAHETSTAPGLAPPGAPPPDFRVRTLRGKFLVAERRCRRCSSGWNRLWKLRVPGGSAAAPLITASRVYFAARDNRVYCVKRRNGHRVWSSDLQGRVSRPIVLLDGVPGPDSPSVLLVVPGDGSRILALDPERGLRIATHELGEDQGRIVGAPIPLESGHFVVARQHYAPESASFMWFRLVPSPEPGSSGEMPYNGGPVPGPPPGS